MADSNKSRREKKQRERGKSGFPVKGKLEMPPGLDDMGKEMWQSIIDAMPEGLITSVDAAALFGLCRWWSTFRYWSKLVDSIDDLNQKARCQRAANTAWQNYQKTAVEFGFTPKSRQGIIIDQVPDEQDTFALWLKRAMGNENQL